MEKIIEMIDPIASTKRADDNREKDEKIDDARKNSRQWIAEMPLDECQHNHDHDSECAHEHFCVLSLCVHIVDACNQRCLHRPPNDPLYCKRPSILHGLHPDHPFYPQIWFLLYIFNAGLKTPVSLRVHLIF